MRGSHTDGTSRRAVLAAPLTARLVSSLSAIPLAAPLLAMAGCTATADATPATTAMPDVSVLAAAIAAKKDVITLYTAVRAAYPALAPRLDPLMADNTAHLAELRRRFIRPPRGRAAAPRGSAPAVPPGRGAALATLRSAEHAAAAAHVAQLGSITPSLAQLLASIAASEATHVAALSRQGLTP